MARAFCRLALLALSVSVLSAGAAPRVLFPKNLHLTRQIQEPLGGKTITMEEYCSGNRIVSISGDRTVIVDYEKQEITDIDRTAGTYSITRFEEVATVIAENGETTMTRRAGPNDASQPRRNWSVTPLGVRGAAGRSVEQFEFVDDGEFRRKVDVGIDRSVALTREAVEVLIGAAYPNPVRDEHEPLLRAANARPNDNREIKTNNADAQSDEPTYGLPVTQAFTYSESGTEITFRSTITRIGAETVPADSLIIPPAAKRVESRAAALRRQLRELDHPTSTSAPRGN